MANNSSTMQGGTSRSCPACRRRFRTSVTNTSICSDCQKIFAESKRQKLPGIDTNPITSEYLQLLDSRIAELEHAAELSSASEQSGGSAATTYSTAQLGRLGSVRPTVSTPYINDSSRSSGVYSSKQPQSSVAIERYLNDSAEPESV